MTGRGARPGTNMEREGSLSVGQICRGLGGWAGGSGCLGVHLVVFFLGATVLTLLNVARSPDDLWFWRPLAWWSGLILLHAGLTLGGVTRRVRVRRADAPTDRGTAGSGRRTTPPTTHAAWPASRTLHQASGRQNQRCSGERATLTKVRTVAATSTKPR